MKREHFLVIFVLAGLLALNPVSRAGETELSVALDTDENIYASFALDGENVWVEIEGITVRRRFSNVEDAIDFVESKYESRTDSLLNNDRYLRKQLNRLRDSTLKRDQMLRTEHQELESEHDLLNRHFLSFVASTHERLANLEFKIDFLYFAGGILALGLSIVALFAPELSPDEEKPYEELESEVEKLKEQMDELES